MKKLFLSIVTVFFWISVYSEPGGRITWEPVRGAWGYALEVKNSDGNVIVNTEIQDSFYPVTKFEPGDYSFRVSTINMLKQKGDSTGWVKFTVEKLYVPQLASVSKKQLVSSYRNRNIIIKGKNFRPESTFLLRGNDKEIKLTDVDIVSENEVKISYKPSSTLQGKYDLVIINRGDVESVLKDAVEIVTPEAAETFVIIGGGYLMNTPMGVFKEYLAPSYTGGKLYLQFSLKSPTFENILLETEVNAVQYNNAATKRKSSLQYVSLGLGAGYYYPFESVDLEMFLKFNTGPAYSILTLDENIVDKKSSSLDLFAMAGVGFRLYIGDSFFIEPACSWKTVFYSGGYLNEVGGSLSAGVKF